MSFDPSLKQRGVPYTGHVTPYRCTDIRDLHFVKCSANMSGMTTTSDTHKPLVVPTLDGNSTVVPIVRNLAEASFMNEDFPAVITVGPRSSEVNFGHPNHLVQSFGDVTYDCKQAPKWHHVEKITEFGVVNDGPILIHCHAGMSRSTSSAIGVLLARGVDPLTAVAALAEIHPKNRPFIPNPIVVGILAEMYDYPDLPRIVAEHEYYPRRWL